jgi:cyclase
VILQPRIIPVLLLHKGGLYKTKKFKSPSYIGDPINAVRIFNEKEVDELLILDIDCSKEKKEPNYSLIEDIVSEAFMPVGYGGGISSLELAQKVFQLGVEKIILNTALEKNISLLTEISSIYGSQSVVACIDYKKTFFLGNKVFFKNGTRKSNFNPIQFALLAAKYGAGELILSSIDREGTYQGYDLKIFNQVVKLVKIPVVVSGGANSFSDFEIAKQFGASGMAAGSMFVYQRPHNAVLITYPTNLFYS